MIINKGILPNEDIIPITYMGGTGGNFLCHFIISAKCNIKNVIELSEHGNAHAFSLKDINALPKGINFPDNDKVEYLLSQVADPKIKKPYYASCHIRNLEVVNNNFKRSIRIVYDKDDVPEITNVFYGKWVLDNKTKSFMRRKEIHEADIRDNQLNFVEVKDMSNVLFITWKEYVRGNIDDFINKLSTFTNINIDNFSKESLIHWRMKTQECIVKFSG